MKRLIGLILVGSALLFGQGQQTIYQQLFSSSNPANGTVSSVVVNNGQAQHMLNYYVFNQPTKTCTFMTSFRLEGSFDGVNFVGISPISYIAQGASVTTPFSNTVFGYGIYPYVRARVVEHDVNNCLVSVWYGGTLFPASPNDVAFSWLGYLNLGGAVAAGTPLTIATTPSGGVSSTYGKPTLFALYLNIQTGATVGSITCRTADLSTLVSTIYNFTLSGLASVNLTASKQAYMQCPINTAMVLTSSGTGNIYVNSLYRFE